MTGKVLPYSLPNFGRGADLSVQAVSAQVTFSSPGGRLPSLSARPAITFPAEECHHPSTSTELYCLVTEAHRCEQLAKDCYAALSWVEIEHTTYWLQVQRLIATPLGMTIIIYKDKLWVSHSANKTPQFPWLIMYGNGSMPAVALKTSNCCSMLDFSTKEWSTLRTECTFQTCSHIMQFTAQLFQMICKNTSQKL